MLISRRKRKEAKEIKIFLNNTPIEQVTTMKYLGVIIDDKFKLFNILATLQINVPSSFSVYPNQPKFTGDSNTKP